jgi:hypothetical protein
VGREELFAVLAIGLAYAGVRAEPGDDCATPLVVALPADLPFVDQNQHTCGRGNLYDGTNTCLGGFADGEEIIYQLQVTSQVEVEITLDPKGQSWTAVVLSSNCPPAGDGCLAYCADDTSQPRVLDCRYLEAGTYTLMVDCWPTPNGGDCIPSFDLTILACALPHGACCVESVCVGTPPATACAGWAGTWYEGFDCTTFACPIEINPLPETCQTAYAVASAPFSATLATYFASADGPPGSCNEPGTTVMQNDVWFTYTPAQDCSLSLTVQYSLYDGLTAVYTGPNCQTLSELYCLNSGGPGDPAVNTLSLAASAGTTYWFQIGDHGVNPGGGATLLALSGAGAFLTGDVNCNGSVGLDDINPFVLLLSNPSGWQNAFPGCPMLTGDINGDGTIDFADINPFVALLSGRRAPARTR